MANANNFISHLRIRNFKSIESLELDCKRVNIFIGRPNVGKSNIVEALSLFSVPFLKADPNLKNLIRFENIKNIFYFNDKKQKIAVETNAGSCIMDFDRNNLHIYFSETESLTNEIYSAATPHEALGLIKGVLKSNGQQLGNDENHFLMDNNYFISNYEGSISSLNSWNPNASFVKRYVYQKQTRFSREDEWGFLVPPFGENLFDVLNQYKELRKEFSNYFLEYGYKLKFDIDTTTLAIVREEGNYLYSVPFHLVADTLKRMIFFNSAISTNENSVLLFEEPEAHAFPPNVVLMAERILAEKSNQYFIATHSPEFTTKMIEKGGNDEVGIFIVTYDNFRTKVRELTEEDKQQILDNSIELFFNISAFAE